MILVGDIAVPYTQLALYEHDRDAKGRIHLGAQKAERRFQHQDYPNLESIFTEFFSMENIQQEKENIFAVCISVAGPVTGKCFTLANMEWTTGRKHCCKEDVTQFLFCPVPVLFINYMEAIGYSIFTSPQEEQETLDILHLNGAPKSIENDEEARYALMVVVKGLGQTLWSRSGKLRDYNPSPSEGGHADFAARNDEEINLLKYFQSKSQDSKHPPISYEQVLSLDGLLKILAFVEENSQQSSTITQKLREESDPLKQTILLAEAAIQDDIVCKETWGIFLSILGAQAGNVALTYRSEGGVYLTGFILTKLIEQLRLHEIVVRDFFEPFLNAFSHKEGDFAEMNKHIPVNIVCKTGLAIAGAAQHTLPLVSKGFFEVNRKLRDQ